MTALDKTILSISDNDFIAVIGPSGSGKTTLLSVLGGMLAPSAGHVMLNGQSLYGLSVRERTKLRSEKIGFVFQSFNLIPWLTAVENVQVPLMLAGRPEQQQRSRAIELLERVGLADRTEHRPGELSQGQQQRVALARTLANDPQVILADEPTGNLDSETKQQVMEYLSGVSSRRQNDRDGHSRRRRGRVCREDHSTRCRRRREMIPSEFAGAA